MGPNDTEELVPRSCFTRIATAWLSQGDAQRSALWFSRMVDAGADGKKETRGGWAKGETTSGEV